MTDLVIPEEAYEQAADALAALLASWPMSATLPHHPELSPRDLLRAFAITALEAAYPAIRQQVAEQIAVALDARAAAWTTPNPVPEGWDSHHLIVRGASELANDNAAKIAREIGAQG